MGWGVEGRRRSRKACGNQGLTEQGWVYGLAFRYWIFHEVILGLGRFNLVSLFSFVDFGPVALKVHKYPFFLFQNSIWQIGFMRCTLHVDFCSIQLVTSRNYTNTNTSRWCWNNQQEFRDNSLPFDKYIHHVSQEQKGNPGDQWLKPTTRCFRLLSTHCPTTILSPLITGLHSLMTWSISRQDQTIVGRSHNRVNKSHISAGNRGDKHH